MQTTLDRLIERTQTLARNETIKISVDEYADLMGDRRIMQYAYMQLPTYETTFCGHRIEAITNPPTEQR